MSQLRVLYITPPVPHSFPHSSPPRAAHSSRCQGPPDVWGGGGAREREIKESYRATERAPSPFGGGWGVRDTRTVTSTAMHPLFFPLCLIMSLLMLILPSDASHFIKGLTFACNPQTSDGVPISSRIREMSACGVGYERPILSPPGAEEAGWFVLVLSVTITSWRLQMWKN